MNLDSYLRGISMYKYIWMKERSGGVMCTDRFLLQFLTDKGCLAQLFTGANPMKGRSAFDDFGFSREVQKTRMKLYPLNLLHELAMFKRSDVSFPLEYYRSCLIYLSHHFIHGLLSFPGYTWGGAKHPSKETEAGFVSLWRVWTPNQRSWTEGGRRLSGSANRCSRQVAPSYSREKRLQRIHWIEFIWHVSCTSMVHITFEVCFNFVVRVVSLNQFFNLFSQIGSGSKISAHSACLKPAQTRQILPGHRCLSSAQGATGWALCPAQGERRLCQPEAIGELAARDTGDIPSFLSVTRHSNRNYDQTSFLQDSSVIFVTRCCQSGHTQSSIWVAPADTCWLERWWINEITSCLALSRWHCNNCSISLNSANTLHSYSYTCGWNLKQLVSHWSKYLFSSIPRIREHVFSRREGITCTVSSKLHHMTTAYCI